MLHTSTPHILRIQRSVTQLPRLCHRARVPCQRTTHWLSKHESPTNSTASVQRRYLTSNRPGSKRSRPSSEHLILLEQRSLSPWVVAFVLTAGYAIYSYSYLNEASQKLNTATFTPFTIVEKQKVSSTAAIITLRPFVEADTLDPYAEWWEKGIWSVQFVQPQIQIARSYTPLPPPAATDLQLQNGDLRFLIRKEEGGEMSNYLHRRAVGDIIEIRGPHLEYEMPHDAVDITFIAGGTGIAPALQAAHTVLSARRGENRTPTFRVVWANRRREECHGGVSSHELSSQWSFWKRKQAEPRREPGALVREIENLKKQFPGQFTIDYFVDEESTYIRRMQLEQLLKRDSSKAVTWMRGDKGRSRALIAVSGPEGFIAHLAGPKIWEDGRQKQGPLSGLLGSMSLRNTDIVKL